MPYKGAADAVTAVLGGQVQMFFGDIGGVMPLIREGRLRALALSGETRSPEIPELPTMIESGVPDYVVLTFIGVVAPAATPPAIVDKLNAAINASLQTPEVVAAAKQARAELRPASPRISASFSPASGTSGARWCDSPASRCSRNRLLRRACAG